MKPPAYFENIRQRSSERWKQLEADKELAGPWHQLFRQVQSPRHVLSELLQNADDAGAKKACVHFDGETFVFDHDGADFTEEQFASLCRFGFSNKRSLHTIGFRGIGFKSTFSLGNTVEVLSPTLAVEFHKKRFTEPVWIDGQSPSESTRVRVTVTDKNRANQLGENLNEWTNSPSSLLFFRNLQEITINEVVVKKRVVGDGPVPNSRYLSLSDDPAQKVLLIQSAPESLPDDAVAELSAERDVDDLHLPPCEVEIVLGLSKPQRLHVVLPTGVEIPLPFSINAPFVQDPARMKIKDPSTSPTNRWLLERAGRHLADTKLTWLEKNAASMEHRAQAYHLLPDTSLFDGSLGGQCAKSVLDTFCKSVGSRPFILTTSGELVGVEKSFSVPVELYAIWEPESILGLFQSGDYQHVVAKEINSSAIKSMGRHNWLKQIAEDGVILRLKVRPKPPKPPEWNKLQLLWEFAERELKYAWEDDILRELHIVPVHGEHTLDSAKDLIRMSSKRDQISEIDWQFLTANISIISPDWIAWVAKLVPQPIEGSKRLKPTDTQRMLQRLGLHEPTSIDRIVAKASERLFGGKEIPIVDCVRVAQILAALSAKAPQGFKFVTRDLRLREINHGIASDDSGTVEELVPEDWAEAHILHSAYTQDFTSCTSQQWNEWVGSEGSGLNIFVPIEKICVRPWHRPGVEQIAEERGGHKPSEYHYRRDSFLFEDFGFDKTLLEFWERQATDSPELWGRIMEAVLKGPPHAWKDKMLGALHHEGTQYRKTLDCGNLHALWIHRFKGLACIPDTFGKYHAPAELLLRTPDTEPLMGIEAFVHPDLDTHACKPLLRALGVQDNPADASKIVGRIRSLSKLPNPERIITEVARLYEALDRVIARVAPGHLGEIAATLAAEPLILSESNEWMCTGEISIFGAPETAEPGIHFSVQRLAMWPRLDVPERPSVEKTIEWLQSLPAGKKLDTAQLKRVRFALQRDPVRIWHSCQHWLTLDNTWTPVSQVKFRLTKQELTKWSVLAPAIRKATANFQMLNEETAGIEPFSGLRNLSDSVEFRVMRCEGGDSTPMPGWLEELASGLCRVRIGSEDETQRIRTVAQRLRGSQWSRFSHIEVTPYVDGDPAGEPTSPKAFWADVHIYAANVPIARLHKDLAEEIARPFSHSGIASAIAACIDRDREFVREYLADSFTLDPEVFNAKQPGPIAQPETTASANGESQSEVPDSDKTDNQSESPDGNEHEAPDIHDGEDGHADTSKPRRPEAPHTPTLIERYAHQRGFRSQGQKDRFTHPDGRWLEKDEQPFHWAEHRVDGDLVRHLWVCDQRLSRGIEVAHELWQTIKSNPEQTAIVSIGEDDRPVALTGVQLIEQKGAGKLAVHPARYRLVSAASVLSNNGGLI